MACCYTNKKEFSMEYQVSTSMLSCIHNTAYAIIRLIFAGWTWIVLGYSLYYNYIPEYDTIYDKSECCIQYWPLYFTYWGLGFTSLYWLCIVYLSLRANSGINLSESCCDRLIFNLMRVIFIFGSISSIIITVAFWTLVFDPSKFDANGGLKWLIATINWHGVTALLITIEWFFNSLQLRLYMTIFVIIYGAAYLGLLALHYSQNWTDETGQNKYVYEFMDFHTDARQSVINGAIFGFAGAVLFVIMMMLQRVMMNTCFYDESNKFEMVTKEDSLPEPSAPSMKSYDQQQPGSVYPQLDNV